MNLTEILIKEAVEVIVVERVNKQTLSLFDDLYLESILY